MSSGMLRAVACILIAVLTTPADARRSAMSNTPEIALIADLPDDSRFEAYGPDGRTVTLDLGWSYREFSAFWMPFAAWKELGLVFYSRGPDGVTNLAPVTDRELEAIRLLTARDYEREFRFPYWRYFWGWIPVLGIIALVLGLRRAEAKRREAAGFM